MEDIYLLLQNKKYTKFFIKRSKLILCNKRGEKMRIKVELICQRFPRFYNTLGISLIKE